VRTINLDAVHKISGDTRNKTLLVITPDFPEEKKQYIGSIFVKDQIEPLKKYFRQIIVICPVLFSFRVLPNDRYCTDYQYDNVTVYYPRCFFLPRGISIPCMNNKKKMSFDFRYAAVRRIIEKENIRFDLIHAHFTWPSGAIAVRLKEEFQVPVVVTIHEDSGWLEEELKGNDPRIKATWENADALIRVNRTEVPVLQKFNTAVFAVPNGFAPLYTPLDMQESRRALNLPKEQQILFAFGDLLERKGFQYLIEAMKLLSDQHKDLLCIIAGKGRYKPHLNNMIKKLNLEDNVVILDQYIPTEKMPVWINSANLFIFPSLKESFGIVQVEALACGKPVIAARNTGSSEVIASDDVGILCEPGSGAALADAIACGLDRSWDSAKILEYAQQYRWETVVGDLVRIYTLMLAEKPPAHST
jgi:teichuronic acid biosynthesis glycosyltransferase TuaC